MSHLLPVLSLLTTPTLAASLASAQSIITDPGTGKAAGISGIVVDGPTYDALFVGGSWVDVFAPCAVLGDLDFDNQRDAVDASAALATPINGLASPSTATPA